MADETTITIALTPGEQNALMQLVDVALRHRGEGALDVAAHFKAKMGAAHGGGACGGGRELCGPPRGVTAAYPARGAKTQRFIVV